MGTEAQVMPKPLFWHLIYKLSQTIPTLRFPYQKPEGEMLKEHDRNAIGGLVKFKFIMLQPQRTINAREEAVQYCLVTGWL